MVRGGPLGSAVLVAWLVPVWNELVDEGVRESPPPNTDKVVNGAGTWPWVRSVGSPTKPLDMKDPGCFCLDVVNFAIIVTKVSPRNLSQADGAEIRAKGEGFPLDGVYTTCIDASLVFMSLV